MYDSPILDFYNIDLKHVVDFFSLSRYIILVKPWIFVGAVNTTT